MGNCLSCLNNSSYSTISYSLDTINEYEEYNYERRNLKIKINEQYQIQCLLIDSLNKETSVCIQDNIEWYTPFISFENNKIIISHYDEFNNKRKSKENNHSHFLQDLITNPNDYKLYSIHFQQNDYSILSEVLLALFILEFKKKIEKDFIISNTMLDLSNIPIESNINFNLLHQRINISLQSIDLNGIEINEDDFQHDYTDQGELLDELIQKKENYDYYHGMLMRAEHIIESNQSDNKSKEKKMKKLQKCIRKIYSEETFYQQITLRFTTKERSQMKLTQLDNYCLFIASRYFNTLEDHQNFTFVCKRLKRNMEKFHYNPISVNQKSLQLFPYIQTLHCYTKEDKYLKGNNIIQYVDWYTPTRIHETQNFQKQKNELPIEYKCLVYSKQQARKDNLNNKSGTIIIPNGIRELEYDTLTFNSSIDTVEIPNTVTKIPKRCFNSLSKLTNLTIPLNQSRVLHGNYIFDNKPFFDLSFEFDNKLKVINGENIHPLTSITIPSHVTKIANYCLCIESLKEIILPDSIIENYTEMNFLPNLLKSVTNISFPLNETRLIGGRNLYSCKSDLSLLVQFSSKLTHINGTLVDNLIAITIPSHVTSIDKTCLDDFQYKLKELSFSSLWKQFDWNWLSKCVKLTKLSLPDTLTNIPYNLFMHFPKLQEISLSSKYYKFNNKLFYEENACLSSIEIPKSVNKINEKEIEMNILETFTIPSHITKLSDYCFRNSQELTEIIGLEHIKNVGKDCFVYCPKLKKEQYSMIQNNSEEIIIQLLSINRKKQLEKWIGLKCCDIIFDSKVDNWSKESNTLNDRIIGKSKLVFIIEDEDNEMFGYYLNSEVMNNRNQWNETDEKSFHFNLLSKNYRLPSPMKFEIIDTWNGGYWLWDELSNRLISIGDICIYKEYMKSLSRCFLRSEYRFNYHGIPNALCGKTTNYLEFKKNENTFIPQRIVVIQMG